MGMRPTPKIRRLTRAMPSGPFIGKVGMRIRLAAGLWASFTMGNGLMVRCFTRTVSQFTGARLMPASEKSACIPVLHQGRAQLVSTQRPSPGSSRSTHAADRHGEMALIGNGPIRFAAAP
jgi:hypothetical protein